MIAILTGPYLLTRLFLPEKTSFAANIGASFLFFFTGIGHFVKTDGMASMLPSSLPYKIPLVYATGILEFALAILLCVPSTRRRVALSALLLLILFLPVNIYAAFQHADIGGHSLGPLYLLIRIPLQLVICAWIYYFSIRLPSLPSS